MEQRSDEACFDAMFSGVSFLSLLNSTPPQEKALLPKFSSGEASSSNIPATSNFFNEDFPALSEKPAMNMKSNTFFDFTDKLKAPKSERSMIGPTGDGSAFGFGFNGADKKLPKLQSVEQAQQQDAKFSLGESSSSSKRCRYAPSELYTLDDIVRSFKQSRKDVVIETPCRKPEPPVRRVKYGNSSAQKRRERISETARCLQELMPWEKIKRMNMATLLEEAYKYVKFLQAQIKVLQTMPLQSSFVIGGGQNAWAVGVGGGELGRLSRQELLGVLVNSSVAQTMMYSQGCCVYSLEQLILVKKIIAERRRVM